jgi:hypothetical protein
LQLGPFSFYLKKLRNAKKLGQFAASKLKTIPSGNENHGNETLNKFMLEIRFSYLDFKWPPFPNRLS